MIVILLVTLGVESYFIFSNKNKLFPQIIKPAPVPKSLLIYDFQNLKNTKFPETSITFGDIVSQNSDSVLQMFYYSVPVKPGSNVLERVSGLANIPKKPGNYPVIVMFRGFIPDNVYQPGADTRPTASVLVKNGYITLAPDFLGYGQSSKDSISQVRCLLGSIFVSGFSWGYPGCSNYQISPTYQAIHEVEKPDVQDSCGTWILLNSSE